MRGVAGVSKASGAKRCGHGGEQRIGAGERSGGQFRDEPGPGQRAEPHAAEVGGGQIGDLEGEVGWAIGAAARRLPRSAAAQPVRAGWAGGEPSTTSSTRLESQE